MLGACAARLSLQSCCHLMERLLHLPCKHAIAAAAPPAAVQPPCMEVYVMQNRIMLVYQIANRERRRKTPVKKQKSGQTGNSLVQQRVCMAVWPFWTRAWGG